MRTPRILIALVTGTILGACAADTAESPGDLGTLQLALSATDSDRTVYRLRNANFRIDSARFDPYAGSGGSAPYSETLSSDDYLSEGSIIHRVPTGDYVVTLENDDWYLERMTASGPERVEQAVLLSERQLYAYVYNRSVQPVVFQFGVDGELIDFRYGDLNICITIERPGDPPAGSQGFPGFAGFPGMYPYDPCGNATGSGGVSGGDAGRAPAGGAAAPAGGAGGSSAVP